MSSDNLRILRAAVGDALYEALFLKMDFPTVSDIPKHLTLDWGIPVKPSGAEGPGLMVAVTGRFDITVVPRHQRSGEVADIVRAMIARGDV